MSPLDAKLILDEIAKLNRRFDESYARMERCFSRTLAALEPRGDAVELRVGSPEQFGATQPVVADNWGGLFVENPAFFPATDTTFTVPDAPACITPAPPVSAAAFDPTKENEPEESLPAEYQHRIQELEEKLQDDDIAAPEEALSKRPPDAAFDSKLSGTVGKATSTDKPRLSLMYPLPQTDLDRLYELGRRKLKQVVSPIEPVPVELALHILDDTRVVTLQRATGTHSPRLMERIADLNASYGGGEVEFVGVDMQRIYNGFMPDDPGLLGCVRLTFRPSFVERVLRASAPGGYDGSLDDDPEFGIPHVIALLDRAIGRDGQAPAAAAALRSDAVGAAGGGLLAWEMAVGSAQSTCSTIFLAGDSSFAEVFLVRVTELSITAVSAPLAYTVAPHREAAATYIVLVPVAAIVVSVNGGEPGFHLSIINDASAISADAFTRIMKDVLAHHGEASSPLLLLGHGPMHAYDAASDLYDPAATTPHNWFALQASQHAVEFVTDSIELSYFHAMLLFVDALPTPDVTMEHASPGVRQVFEVLSLHADIFCNFSIVFELLGHMSLEVNRHQPWPPPDELRLTGCAAELRPTPWPSFNMSARCSVSRCCGCIWKPPGPLQLRKHIRYRAVTSAYYRGALGVLLFHDIPRRPSFLHITRWLDAQAHADKNIVIMLVGNKSDLEDQRVVSTDDVEEFAERENLFFMENEISVHVLVMSMSHLVDQSDEQNIPSVADLEPSEIWKWSTDFPDMLVVLLAERGVDALDEIDRIAADAKLLGTLTIVDILAFTRAIYASRQKLADQFAEVACESSIVVLSFELPFLLSRDLMDLVLIVFVQCAQSGTTITHAKPLVDRSSRSEAKVVIIGKKGGALTHIATENRHAKMLKLWQHKADYNAGNPATAQFIMLLLATKILVIQLVHMLWDPGGCFQCALVNSHTTGWPALILLPQLLGLARKRCWNRVPIFTDTTVKWSLLLSSVFNGGSF